MDGLGLRHRWWRAPASSTTGTVSIVVVSHNTLELLGLLMWSARRSLGAQLKRLVVVDNGSTDGSRALADLGVEARACDAVVNHTNLYHGPALNQGVSYLAKPGENAPRHSAAVRAATQ